MLLLPVMSMGSRAKVSSSLCARLVCSAWSVIAGRGSVGPESGLSGAPASDAQQQVHEPYSGSYFWLMFSVKLT